MENVKKSKIFFLLTILLCCLLSGNSAISQDYNIRYYIQRSNDPNLETSIRLNYIDSLINHHYGNQDSLLSKKIKLAYESQKYGKVVEAYRNLNKESLQNIELSSLLQLRYYYIKSLFEIDSLINCLEEVETVLSIKKPDSLKYYDALMNYLLYDLDHYSHSDKEDYINKNEKILKEALKNRVSSSAIDIIRHSVLSMKMHEAIHHKNYYEAINYADSLSQTNMSLPERKVFEVNLGYLYILIGKYDAAKSIFRKIIASTDINNVYMVALLNLTHILNEEGDYEETIRLIENQDSIPFRREEPNLSFLMGNLAIAYANTNNYKKAFDLMLESKLLSDSIYTHSEINDKRLSLDFKTIIHESNIIRRDNKRKNASIIILSLTGVILLILLSFFINKWMKNRKSIKILNKINKDLDTEFQNVKNQLTREIEINEKEIADLSLILSKDTYIIEECSKILKDTDIKKDEKLSKIREILQESSISPNSGKEFMQQFEKSYSRFMNRLSESYPDLLRSELIFCVYLIMNMSTKEIASITNKSIRSVESTRYRISKKINVPSGTSIVKYLGQFLNN